ncbi:ankyrin repeat family protein [Francisella tularensis subsp. novicida F6168]|nr:ankyrin repeat family protein [Francisella tularensis subsp. novicida F6168]
MFDAKGMCYGIAYMAIQAIIRDDLVTYISRIEYLEKKLLQHNNNQDAAINEIVEKINVAYEKRKNKQNLDCDEIKLLDILNWLDGVQIYHNYNNVLSGGQNYEIATDFFSANTNQKEKENRKIFVIAKELNILTKELIDDIFDKIDNSKEPIAFSLSAPGHIISIGKSSNYKPIYLINHNIHKHILNEKSLYSEVFCAFKYSMRIALSIFRYSYQEENISIKYVTNNLDKDDLCKLLCLALQDGYLEAIKAYIDAISNLSGINKQQLLAAKKQNGTPGLYMALQNGHAEAIKVYIEGISNLSGINKQELLAAKRRDGVPALCMALYNGQAEAIKVYIEGTFNLPGINRRELLAAKMPDGTPGLNIALQQGHSQAVKTYKETISKFMMLRNGLPGFLL